MNNTTEFISALLKRYPDISILAIVHSTPEWLYDHKGDVVIIGFTPPLKALKSTDVRFLKSDNTAQIWLSLKKVANSQRSQPFDLIFVKHDHSFRSLKEQINAALGVSGPETLFLFDDAVPPKLSMAGPRPTPGEPWFVGEVWVIKHLLISRSSDYFADTADIKPTGLLAAAGFDELSEVQDEKYRAVTAEVRTDEQLQSMACHTDTATLLAKCNNALKRSQQLSILSVRAGLEGQPLVESRLVDSGGLWNKPEPNFILDLSGRSLDTTRLRQTSRMQHSKHVDTFSNVLLLGSDTFIKDGNFYCRNHKATPYTIERRARAYGYHQNYRSRLFVGESGISLSRQNYEFAKTVDTPVLLGSPDEYENWGMWIILAIPSVYEFQNSDRSKYQKFLCNIQHPWQSALLKYLGLSSNDILPHDVDQVYYCRELSVIRHSSRDLIVTGSDRAILDDVRAKILKTKPLQRAPKKIFLSRITRTRKHGAYRALTNEQELIDRLQPLGFEVVEPEYMSFAEQVATFASAETIVGLGGAAMFNTLFCYPGTKIIDIESSLDFVDAHTNLFGSAKLDYGVIIGQQDLEDHQPEQKRWSLDVQLAVQRILDFVSE